MSRNLSRAALLGIVLFNVGFALAAELQVPQQYATIQGALDAAQSGDTVLVSPGTYFENLAISRAVSLRSTGGAQDTVIDGGRTRVVIEVRGTGMEKVAISGFTITNGFHGPAFQSGGIYLDSVIAVIADNVIRNNSGCLGSGISTTAAAVTIERNRIADNPQDPACFGADGGGIFLNVDGAGPSLVANNIIAGHTIGGRGAGIAANAMTRLAIRENLITHNHADAPGGGAGGGILLTGGNAVVTGNVLSNNSAQSGGAMALFPTDNADRIMVHSNVMGQNRASLEGSAVLLVTVSQQGLQMVHNVIDGDSPVALIRCGGVEFQVSPSNRLRNDGGPVMDGNCVSPPRNAP